MAYKIEKNIPIPPKRGGKGSKYPWGEMKQGDSFFVPGKPNEVSKKWGQMTIRLDFLSASALILI
jgi:hypothetical protein